MKNTPKPNIILKTAVLVMVFCFLCKVQNIHAQAMKSDSVTAKLKVSFMVEKDGDIKSVQVLESSCPDCNPKTLKNLDKNAREAIKKMKKYRTQRDENGDPVSFRYTIPLTLKVRQEEM